MIDRCPVLVANAPLRWTSKLAEMAAEAQPLLAADGGANHLARIGLKPTEVIGDLDSIADQTRTWIGEERMVHRPDPDRSDLDKALSYAFFEIGLTDLTVLAALGGRTDHDLGNLGLLARFRLGERLVFEDDEQRVLSVAGAASLSSRPGETWSFWTFDPSVLVTLEGVRWPVERTPLDVGSRPSVSNEAVADRVRIQAEGGAVVVVRHL